MHPSFHIAVSLVACLFLAAGCSLKKAYPVRHTFLLDARRASEPPLRAAFDAVLLVRPVTVAAPFDDKGFVYRDTGLAYETDFYHRFLVPPRSLITDATRQWLAVSGLFRAVIDSSSRISPSHALEANLTALYGDYRNPTAPEAVLAIHFHFLREIATGPSILFHRAYHESIPLDRPGAEGLAHAWSRGLERVLAALETDLANLDLDE